MVPTPPRCTLFPYTTLFRSSGISTGFPELSRSYRQVAHVLLTHPPLIPQTSIRRFQRSEEHTSELQSRGHLVCRLLLEKKNTCLLQPGPPHGRTSAHRKQSE